MPEGTSLSLGPTLLAEVEAAAREEHRPVSDMLHDLVVQGLHYRRSRAATLAALDAAEASLAAGQGLGVTDASADRLAAEVKARGRVRLASGITAPG